MYGDSSFFFGGCDFGPFFETSDDAVYCVHEILFLYPLFPFAGGNEGGFVAYVGNVGTREARSLSGQQICIDRIIDFYSAKVYFKNLFPVVQVG